MATPETPDVIPELAELRKPTKAFTLPEPKALTGLSTQMGAGVPGVPAPTNYQEAVEQYKTPMQAAQATAGFMQRESELERDITIAKQAQEQLKAEQEAAIAQQQRQAREEKYNQLQAVRNSLPRPQMHPTKENIQSLSTLFGLIGVIGMAMGGTGKMSAQNALGAMTGMMKGWQQGRADLWKKEMQEFDKEMARVKAILEDAYKDAEMAEKQIISNADEARALAQQAQAKLGGQISKQILEKQGISKFREYIGDVYYKALSDAEKRAFEQTKFKAEQDYRDKQLELRKKEVEAKATRADEKALQAIGPALRNIAEQYPDGTANQLVGASTEDKKRIQGSFRALQESEAAADFVARNPKAVGALAVAKNFLKIDAIKSLKSNDEATVVAGKQAIIDQQLDDAVAKRQISKDDAEAAKVLQKKLFGLALQDVQGSGQRGSVYLDRQFQNLYDQASRQETLLKIIRERAEENDRNLRVYKLNYERNKNPDNFPLLEADTQERFNEYLKERTPQKIATQQDVKDTAKGQKITEEEAKKRLKNLGYKIEGEQ